MENALVTTLLIFAAGLLITVIIGICKSIAATRKAKKSDEAEIKEATVKYDEAKEKLKEIYARNKEIYNFLMEHQGDFVYQYSHIFDGNISHTFINNDWCVVLWHKDNGITVSAHTRDDLAKAELTSSGLSNKDNSRLIIAVFAALGRYLGEIDMDSHNESMTRNAALLEGYKRGFAVGYLRAMRDGDKLRIPDEQGIVDALKELPY